MLTLKSIHTKFNTKKKKVRKKTAVGKDTHFRKAVILTRGQYENTTNNQNYYYKQTFFYVTVNVPDLNVIVIKDFKALFG